MGQGTMPPQQIMMDNNNAIKLIQDPDILSSSEVQSTRRCKCVLLGDGAVGKTSITVSYTTNGYPTEYIPTAFDNYTVLVTVDNKPVRVQLCDTAGQDDFDNIRPLCYPDTDAFLVCFSVVSPTSFHNVAEKWIPEIRRTSPKTPVILIGTQCDLRNDVKILIDLASHKERPISESSAAHMANQVGAVQYIECSALTQQNLKEVFDTAIYTALKYSDSHPKERKSSKKAKTKSCDTSPKNDSLKNSKPGWKKLCCFVT